MIDEKFVAGTTFTRVLTLTAYPAPDWQAQLLMRGPGQIDLIAAAEGSQHRFSAASADTASWAPGAYWWALRVTRGGDVLQADDGHFDVLPDIAQAGGGFDGRGHAERVLAAIEAVIENRATLDQERYTINNRELWRTPMADLLLLRDRYRAEVLRKKQAGKCGQSLLGRQIKVII